MGTCSSRVFKSKKSLKKQSTSDTYKVTTETQEIKLEDVKLANVHHPEGIMSPFPNVLRESMVNTTMQTLRGRNNLIPLIVTPFRQPPNIAPVLTRVKAKFTGSFGFDPNAIKSKIQTFGENSATNEEVQDLFKRIAIEVKLHKWKSPTLFKLDLQCCHKLTDKTFEMIANEICRNLPGLKTLCVNFSECVSITDKGLEMFGKIICQKLLFLQSLEIVINRCTGITDKGLQRLGYYISKFQPNLRQLKLSFNECGDLTEKGIKIYGRKIPRRLQMLKQFSLSLNDCVKVTNDEFNIISQPFNNLKNFNLSLHKCIDFNDVVFGKISSQINNNMPDLQQLTLSLHSCVDFTDAGLESFETQIKKNLKHLQYLSLEFDGCVGITNQGVQKLGSWIMSCLCDLEGLTLDFNECVQIDGKVLSEISDKIAYLKNLKFLKLRLGKSETFNDKYLKTFATNLFKNTPKLRSFSVYFGQCQKITDIGFDALVAELRKINTLQILSLDFSGCNKITDRSLSTVETGIGKYLPHLLHLTIDFRGCRGASYHMKDYIRSTWGFRCKFEIY